MSGETILSPAYRIFSQEINGKTFTVSIVGGETLYTIRQGLSVQVADTLNGFLQAAVDELGGVVKRNGTVSEDALEHFGKNINTLTGLKDADTARIGGAGVSGRFEADFSDPANAALFADFIADLLGKDPAMAEIYSFSGGTNSGANKISVLANEEIIGLNDLPVLSDGLRTVDSLLFAWSGADTQGQQTTNNLDVFIEAMGDLFGGTLLQDADLQYLDGEQRVAQVGANDNIVRIREVVPGLGATNDRRERWAFEDAASASNFKEVIEDVFAAIGNVAPIV